MTKPALSVKATAEILSIRTHGVLSLIHSGELRAFDVSLTPGGRPRWRILPDDLDALVARRTHTATPPRRRRKRKPPLVKQYF